MSRPPIAIVPARARALVACGILRKEVEFLVAKNGWTVEPRFLDSALHNYLERLQDRLGAALGEEVRAGRDPVVFYGSCHPRMESLLAAHGARRTAGQNCIAMLLGHERFMAEMERGACFLLEGWALGWGPMIAQCFGKNPEVVREIFHGSHKVMIAVRTPCSGDFRRAAGVAARSVDLPLAWMDADPAHLEAVIAQALGGPAAGAD